MALSFSAVEANVTRHFYLVYMRETTTAIASGNYDTLSNWTTFLTGFQNIGSCENENIKIDEVPDVVPVDYGKELAIGYDGNIEIKFLQTAVADFGAVDDMKAKDCDMLFVDNVNHIFHYIHDKRFLVEKHINSGITPHFLIKMHQICGEAAGNYATIYLTGTIPIS